MRQRETLQHAVGGSGGHVDVGASGYDQLFGTSVPKDAVVPADVSLSAHGRAGEGVGVGVGAASDAAAQQQDAARASFDAYFGGSVTDVSSLHAQLSPVSQSQLAPAPATSSANGGDSGRGLSLESGAGWEKRLEEGGRLWEIWVLVVTAMYQACAGPVCVSE